MKTWKAILLTVAIFLLSLFLPTAFLLLAVAGTSIWAAIDSRRPKDMKIQWEKDKCRFVSISGIVISKIR